MIDAATQWAVSAGAAVTAAAAVGCFREARRIAGAVDDNTDRSRAAGRRSRGNRRFLRWLTPRVVSPEDSRTPSEFDPRETRTDGGEDDA